MRSLLIIILPLLILSCTKEEKTCIDTNCADYSTQAEAQADLELNPECRGDLDADNDGLACENFFNNDNAAEDCPSTSNCGCSSKNKAECNTRCCAWVVGQGCNCR